MLKIDKYFRNIIWKRIIFEKEGLSRKLIVDDDAIYCSIRNGKIITLDKQSYQIKEFNVSGSSMYSLKTYN